MSIKSIQLHFYTEEEIRKLCVVRITNASTYDRGIPRLSGVNDPRLGIGHHTAKCPTCNRINCDQHLGYIQFSRPVYRIGTINFLIQVLRCICRHCAHPKFWSSNCPWPLNNENGSRINITSILREATTSTEKLRLVSEACRSKFLCIDCNLPQPVYSKRARTFIDGIYRPKDLKDYPTVPNNRFMPDEARAILEAMDIYTRKTLDLINPEEMVIRLHIVPPPCIRPSNFIGEAKVRSENDLTIAIQDIVRTNVELEQCLAKDLMHVWDKLQIMVSGLVIHTIKKDIGVKLGLLPNLPATAKQNPQDMKKRLSGKRGRFRGNLSGKRVDQSGRSVIAPDSSHDITQLGVPNNIMNTLTFPEIVNDRNIEVLQEAIIRGAYVDNGAMAVRQPGATAEELIWLPVLDRDARVELASQIGPLWTVERHLRDGDWVIFNRQPSLWKASMMAFMIYRLRNKLCFQLPLPVTKPFNADFDGDEMNIHSLQTYEAIAEAQELLSVPNQMMTPQSHTVIIGLVQDSLVGGYRVTDKNTFLDLDTFQLLACSRNYNPNLERYNEPNSPHNDLGDPIELPWPAILKAPKAPNGLYTGKQLISFLLPTDISLTKVVRNGTDDPLNDNDYICIRNGIHLSGQLCKATLGATNFGIIQNIYKKHGSWAACKFVSDAQRIFVQALTILGPSISIVDCITSIETDNETKQSIEMYLDKARALANIDLPYEVIEAKSSSILQETLRSVGVIVANRLDTHCGLSTVVTAGSKGNLLNISQIAGTVGQQMVFGRRINTVDTYLGSRTLACFEPNDNGPESRGYIKSSYLKGLKPYEFFYHQMSGREGIVATAVNTADSGYNQRRMIKSQESQCVVYDGSVRVSSENIVQLAYGYDDMDASLVGRFKFNFNLFSNRTETLQRCSNVIRHFLYLRSVLLKDLECTMTCPIAIDHFDIKSVTPGTFNDFQLLMSLILLHQKFHGASKWYIPLPAAVCILICERAYQKGQYNDTLQSELVELYQRSMVHPGEGVGALAATCIGEPSMQMTLNVFHYTGIASKNVTITGLPRFKQIINAVDTYQTANMNAELLNYEASVFANTIQCIKIFQIADSDVLPLQDCPYNFLVNPQLLAPGILAQKVYKRKTFNETLIIPKWCIALRPNYENLLRYEVTKEEIGEALLKTLGSEAIVLCGPSWSFEPIYIIPYTIDNDKLFIEAFADAILQVSVRGIEYVKRSIALQETRYNNQLEPYSVHSLDTEGSSFIEFGKLPFINQSSAMTNNIIEASNVLGINAGVSVLQSELYKVLSFDSSYIASCHLSLLAETVCRAGQIRAMNRHNMENLGNSILQRASFEQSMETLFRAAVFGQKDNLEGATERIMVGQPANIGTGIVSLVTKEEAIPKILVAPLRLENSTNTSNAANSSNVANIYVRPLHQSFDLSRFNVKVNEESKDASILNGIPIWRNSAAQYRIIAQFQIRQAISINEYQGILLEANAFEWKQIRPFIQTTLVFYNKKTEDSIESIQYTSINDQFNVQHKIRKIYHQENIYDTTVSTVYHDSPAAANQVPVSIVPDTVIIRQEISYIKNGFVLSLVKEWRGPNNIMAEESFHEDNPNCFFELCFEDPETILQGRANNSQLSSAFINRLT